MAHTITLIHGDAARHALGADLMLTDPPFEMPGKVLASIIGRYDVKHLVLITTMRQLLQFIAESGDTWTLSFDFVLDGSAPKKSLNMRQPHYTHQTGVYLIRKGARSIFDRKRRQRSDIYENNGYWPTIISAPRGSGDYAKNQTAITDILGSFDIGHVIDPFAGTGTTMLAAAELEISGTGIERNANAFAAMKKAATFATASTVHVLTDANAIGMRK